MKCMYLFTKEREPWGYTVWSSSGNGGFPAVLVSPGATSSPAASLVPAQPPHFSGWTWDATSSPHKLKPILLTYIQFTYTVLFFDHSYTNNKLHHNKLHTSSTSSTYIQFTPAQTQTINYTHLRRLRHTYNLLLHHLITIQFIQFKYIHTFVRRIPISISCWGYRGSMKYHCSCSPPLRWHLLLPLRLPVTLPRSRLCSCHVSKQQIF